MHRPPPLLFPVAAASLSTLKTMGPTSFTTLFGISTFSHVSVKTMTLQSISPRVRVQVLNSSNFFARDCTLARKMLRSDGQCGFSVSLARRPPHFPRLLFYFILQQKLCIFVLSWVYSFAVIIVVLSSIFSVLVPVLSITDLLQL